jgi:uncharacterized protein (TIGR02453 family)
MAKKQTSISASTFDFLKLLKENNNREWFGEHKQTYLDELEKLTNFADNLLELMQSHDLIDTPSGKKALHRIYRDTRFSKEKIPYKTNFSGGFSRATKQLRGGYYFHIEPGNCFLAGGFFGPGAEDLRLIREDISFDPKPITSILQAVDFKETFGTLEGDKLKTTPKGFSADDPAIELLRYKQFLLIRKLTDQQVMQQNFLMEANRTFINMRPFFDYMSAVLTTDGDGVTL